MWPHTFPYWHAASCTNFVSHVYPLACGDQYKISYYTFPYGLLPYHESFKWHMSIFNRVRQYKTILYMCYFWKVLERYKFNFYTCLEQQDLNRTKIVIYVYIFTISIVEPIGSLSESFVCLTRTRMSWPARIRGGNGLYFLPISFWFVETRG